MKRFRWDNLGGLLVDLVVFVFALPQMLYFFIWHLMNHYYTSGLDRNILTIYFGIAILCIHSAYRLTAVYNTPLRERYWEDQDAPTFKKDLSFVLHAKTFWIYNGVVGLIYAVLPLDWTFKALANLITIPNPLLDKLVTLAVFYPALLLLAIMAHLSACRLWSHNKKSERYAKGAYTKDTAIMGIGYVVGTFAFLQGLPLIFIAWAVVKEFVTLKLILTILFFVILFVLYRLIRAFHLRKSCLKQLKKICAEQNYSITDIRSPYRSIFTPCEGESFQVTTKEKTYSCKFVGCHQKYTPLAIYPNGTLHFIHRIRILKLDLLNFSTIKKFDYESDNPKIVIINPIPKFVYAFRDKKSYKIDNGEVIGDYKVFSATAFLRALEFDVLHK